MHSISRSFITSPGTELSIHAGSVVLCMSIMCTVTASSELLGHTNY